MDYAERKERSLQARKRHRTHPLSGPHKCLEYDYATTKVDALFVHRTYKHHPCTRWTTKELRSKELEVPEQYQEFLRGKDKKTCPICRVLQNAFARHAHDHHKTAQHYPLLRRLSLAIVATDHAKKDLLQEERKRRRTVKAAKKEHEKFSFERKKPGQPASWLLCTH